MQRDRRYKIIKDLLEAGKVKLFNDVFDAIPKSVVYRDMGMNYNRFQKLLDHPDLFTFREVGAIARLIGCDAKLLIDLVYSSTATTKKRRA